MNYKRIRKSYDYYQSLLSLINTPYLRSFLLLSNNTINGERFFIYVNIIKLLSGECTGEKFELLDSVKHNTGSYPITIRYMKLYIEPDFSNKSIYCIQDLRLQHTKHSDEPVVSLDSADLGIKKILFRDSENIEPTEDSRLCMRMKDS